MLEREMKKPEEWGLKDALCGSRKKDMEENTEAARMEKLEASRPAPEFYQAITPLFTTLRAA